MHHIEWLRPSVINIHFSFEDKANPNGKGKMFSSKNEQNVTYEILNLFNQFFSEYIIFVFFCCCGNRWQTIGSNPEMFFFLLCWFIYVFHLYDDTQWFLFSQFCTHFLQRFFHLGLDAKWRKLIVKVYFYDLFTSPLSGRPHRNYDLFSFSSSVSAGCYVQ